ncbi:MAG TPA: cytochrome c oxidase subunit 3 [Steroidobacteraceae bacterium]|nr:cytochrome c oxidase subunit 3 [Steroidobacteraceae bacterium]
MNARSEAPDRPGTTDLGMWVFLASEVLFFGALLNGFLVYRIAYPESFGAGSAELDFWLGGINTGVLLTSSLTMALAVAAVRAGRLRATLLALGATALLGCLFLGVKAIEYSQEIAHGLAPWRPGATFALGAGDPGRIELFFNFYFAMTGLHAVHLLVGIGVVVVVLARAVRAGTAAVAAPVEGTGLYWHFVDVIWIFLYPMLYLIPG